MVCIYCGGSTQVSNSRPQKRLGQTWRRRTCTRCFAVFTTIEIPDFGGSLRIAYPDGSLRPFSRDELFLSLHAALSHREDAISVASSLVAIVMGKLLKTSQEAKLTRSLVIDTVHHTLEHFDAAAAVFYAAHHR